MFDIFVVMKRFKELMVILFLGLIDFRMKELVFILEGNFINN